MLAWPAEPLCKSQMRLCRISLMRQRLDITMIITNKEKERQVHTMQKKQFANGDVIFRQGDQGESFYQILGGKVGVYANYQESGETLLTELTKGQFLGEMAVIEAFPRSATAVSLADDTEMLEIPSGKMDEYFRTEPDMIVEIMRYLADRVRSLTDDYSEVSATIKELHPGEKSGRSEGLMKRLKKHSAYYKMHKKTESQISVEASRAADAQNLTEGFSKQVESFPKGTVLFREGEVGNCMYDVHYGKVGIYKDYGTEQETLLTELFPNQFFGEMGMISDNPRSATAITLEDDTMIETIRPEDLQDLFEQNPPKVHMILSHLSSRLRKLTKEYLNACRLVYQVTEAEEKNEAPSAELTKETKEYRANYYD